MSGPLAGLAAAVKDLYEVAGTRTGGGSPEWVAAQQPAPAHAAAVAKILAAGAIVTGSLERRAWKANRAAYVRIEPRATRYRSGVRAA